MSGRFHRARQCFRTRAEAEEKIGPRRTSNRAARILSDEQVLKLLSVRQLRGEAHPKVQVPNCDIALAQGTGGLLGTRHGSATLILGRE